MPARDRFINWTNEAGFNGPEGEAASPAVVEVKDGRVIVRFPKSPHGLRISMSPGLSRWLAAELLKSADAIETLPIAQTLPPPIEGSTDAR